MTSRTPIRAAKWLFGAYAAGLAGFLIWTVPGEPAFLLICVFIMAWQTGPVALAAMLVKASKPGTGAWLFVGVEAALIASTIWFVVESRLPDPPWTAVGGSMIFGLSGPFFQYLAVVAACGVAWLAGWRAREEWLKA